MKAFEKLNIWLPEDSQLYKGYENKNYNQVTTTAYDSAKTFPRTGVSVKDLADAPVLCNLMEKYKLVPKIFMIEPHSTYNWHVDAFRYIAINCLLTHNDNNYLTLFCDELDKFELVYFKTINLVYEPRRFYLFNTQVPHIITNYSDKPRYLLSIAPYHAFKISNDQVKATQRDFSHFLKVSQELKEMSLID